VQLRASLKLVKLGYFISLLIAVVIVVYLQAIHTEDTWMWGLLAIPVLLALFMLTRHIQRRVNSLTILGDRLRYEAGMISKTTRTMELAKVQDVRVDQTFGQRMLNVGDLSLETAGETSRIVIRSIDRPQEAATHILELSRARHPNV